MSSNEEEAPSPFPVLKERGSRSEARREALDVLALAEALIEVSRKRLDTVAMHPMVREAIDIGAGITAYAARNRQVKAIASILRRLDEEEVLALQSLVDDGHRIDGIDARAAERWVTRLLEEPDALTAFVEAYPAVAVQGLRSRVRAVQKQGAGPRQRKQLLTTVREAITSARS
ncbi:MAG: DUF615 domain-containing protein [Deltaproteobacteria bacterium]|nr:DUF615 domain-containing protein [Deltaproteobacteria bacterium]